MRQPLYLLTTTTVCLTVLLDPNQLSSHWITACLTAFTKKVNHDVDKLFEFNRRRTHSNLSLGERRALQWLKDKDDIVVKPADKRATVIWGKTKYISEALRQLCDPQYYVPLSSKTTVVVREELETMLEAALETEWITDKEYHFLLPDNPWCP